jgi:S-formylglutathione hydrolase FrmB
LSAAFVASIGADSRTSPSIATTSVRRRVTFSVTNSRWRASDVFGLVAGQSGAYNTGTLLSDAAGEDRRAVRFHLVAGSYETALGGDPQGGNLLGAQRRLAAILKTKGYDVVAVERPEGHSWGLWKSELGRALAWLFGPAAEPPYRRPGSEE